ncbi:MAG: hypothetical protein P4L71_17155 [Acetobacteraceae bacterium]|nr:hypothetical protein [Acetobacteraceae bacterium]
MRMRSCLRFCLPFGVTAGLVALLASGHAETPQPPSDDGVVWVYYGAMCAKPGDSSDCKVVQDGIPAAFGTFETCDKYRNDALSRAGNPRLMGVCAKQHEA